MRRFLFLILPLSTSFVSGGAAQNVSQVISNFGVDAVSACGVVPNRRDVDNYPALQRCADGANTNGTVSGRIILPPGTIYVCSGSVTIRHSGVIFLGAGWGQSDQFGTSIKACPGFTGTTQGDLNRYPANFLGAIDGQADIYGSGFENMSFDCGAATNCGGIYKGHANENTHIRDIQISNHDAYGFFICGALGTGTAPSCNAGWNGSTYTGGAQGDGPDTNLIINCNTRCTSNTLGIKVTGYAGRGIRDTTVAGTATSPYGMLAGQFDGIGGVFMGLHSEGIGSAGGFQIGSGSNGASNMKFESVDFTSGGVYSFALKINDCENCAFDNILGGTGHSGLPPNPSDRNQTCSGAIFYSKPDLGQTQCTGVTEVRAYINGSGVAATVEKQANDAAPFHGTTIIRRPTESQRQSRQPQVSKSARE